MLKIRTSEFLIGAANTLTGTTCAWLGYGILRSEFVIAFAEKSPDPSAMLIGFGLIVLGFTTGLNGTHMIFKSAETS